jgi:hypothetical protein
MFRTRDRLISVSVSSFLSGDGLEPLHISLQAASVDTRIALKPGNCPRYTAPVKSQKRLDQDWSPVEVTAAKAAVFLLPQKSAASRSCLLFGGSGGEPSGSPVLAVASR